MAGAKQIVVTVDLVIDLKVDAIIIFVVGIRTPLNRDVMVRFIGLRVGSSANQGESIIFASDLSGLELEHH